MGDSFQVIVDRDADKDAAPGLATAIHDWLVTAGIVLAEPTDCVLGSEAGFAPGPNYQDVVDEKYEHLEDLQTNGLELITSRTIFDSGQGGFELVCSACSASFEPPDEWGKAVGEWYKHEGPGLLSCPDCGKAAPITDWQHDPPWGFANLGFQFWNWPPLKTSFVEEVGKRLGHRVILVAGKL
jgi:hypothetical protein